MALLAIFQTSVCVAPALTSGETFIDRHILDVEHGVFRQDPGVTVDGTSEWAPDGLICLVGVGHAGSRWGWSDRDGCRSCWFHSGCRGRRTRRQAGSVKRVYREEPGITARVDIAALARDRTGRVIVTGSAVTSVFTGAVTLTSVRTPHSELFKTHLISELHSTDGESSLLALGHTQQRSKTGRRKGKASKQTSIIRLGDAAVV